MIRKTKPLGIAWKNILIWAYALSVILLLFFRRGSGEPWIWALAVFLVLHAFLQLFRASGSLPALVLEGCIIALTVWLSDSSSGLWAFLVFWGYLSLVEAGKIKILRPAFGRFLFFGVRFPSWKRRSGAAALFIC